MATRSVEEWARSVISAELGVAVEIHDYGSDASMYDLRIGNRDDPRVAIECWARWTASSPRRGMSASLAARTATLAGNWTVEVRSGARFLRMTQELGLLLHFLEREGVDDLPVDDRLRHRDQLLYDQFDVLGVTYAHRHLQHGTGKVSFTMPGPGGRGGDLVGGKDS